MSVMGLLQRSCPEASEQVVATVLQLVVQHATVELRDVCRWLRLSKLIRQTLQQSVGRLTVLDWFRYMGTIKRLTALARWLPRHAGLVSNLVLQSSPHEADLDPQEWGAAEQMLTLSLQLSSVSRYHSTHPGAIRHPALQVEYFKTNFVLQPAALRSLASSSHLTRLELEEVPEGRVTAELCSALRDVRGLRKLRCELQYAAPDDPGLFPAEFAAALFEMTQLTQLSAIGLAPAASLEHLPASLRQLHLGTGHMPVSTSRVPLSHLTQLQSLSLTAPGGISGQSQLPGCLTALTLTGPAKAVHGLSRLQRLKLKAVHAAIPLLQRPENLANLQRLELALHSCSQQRLQRVADALSGCTQLTMVHLYNHGSFSVDQDIVDLSGVQLRLQGLRQLQRLNLRQIKWDFEGFSQLTVLSSLTKLKCDRCDIPDAGLALVFQRLTTLRKLVLWMFLPDNDCLLVAMSGLSNLEYPNFEPYGEEFGLIVTDATLPVLSSLTKLTTLVLWQHKTETGAHVRSVSDAAQEAFLAGMPYLTDITWNC